MTPKIDRKALATRHNPVIRDWLPLSPLSVGNGEFAFTADLTGLQSFPERYETPLGTLSQWAWHSSGGRRKWSLDDVRLQYRDERTGKGGYPAHAEDREEPYHWLRQNPHRPQLGQIGFRFVSREGTPLGAESITEAEQTLDLWSGVLESRYLADGVPVRVRTYCHPASDELGVRVESPLLREGRLKLAIRFPAPGMTDREWSRSIRLNWDEPETHHTVCRQDPDGGGARFERSMDEDGYRVFLRWSQGRLEQEEGRSHAYVLHPAGEDGAFAFSAAFVLAGREAAASPVDTIEAASREHWARFWQEGAVVELIDSKDPRAAELERRIVLSQFVTAIHSAGSIPPQETGLVYNSWFGKPHLEMHWWHAFHFPLWGRAELLERSMDWYRRILPQARALAASQGYDGARWPKMVGPDGEQSPSGIAPLLIWQQPHPIALAELCYLADPRPETLRRLGEVVYESAQFMASFAEWDEERQRYVLGPPVIPAQERHKPAGCLNPTYELEYWRHGLETAIVWAEREGREAPEKWRDVCARLSALPEREGVYLAHENCPNTYTEVNTDHPSMLGALGMLPGEMADRETMRRTLHKVMESWRWETTWGWDYPMAAMTAARLGEGRLAVELLLKEETKNIYLPNGHNYQRSGLTAYLPGNGGLLTAVALMAGGWRGGPDTHAPGFPGDRSWTVRHEGLQRWM